MDVPNLGQSSIIAQSQPNIPQFIGKSSNHGEHETCKKFGKEAAKIETPKPRS